jgi:hypothetical protein
MRIALNKILAGRLSAASKKAIKDAPLRISQWATVSGASGLKAKPNSQAALIPVNSMGSP